MKLRTNFEREGGVRAMHLGYYCTTNSPARARHSYRYYYTGYVFERTRARWQRPT